MSVKIRLQRIGRTCLPFYRIVVCDESVKRSGRKLDILGTFNPKEKTSFKINKKKMDVWLSRGAQPTEAIRKLLSL